MRNELDMRRSKPFMSNNSSLDNVMGHHRETQMYTALSTVAVMVMVMEMVMEAEVEALEGGETEALEAEEEADLACLS
jgi:hypothetical protein